MNNRRPVRYAAAIVLVVSLSAGAVFLLVVGQVAAGIIVWAVTILSALRFARAEWPDERNQHHDRQRSEERPESDGGGR